MKQRIYRIAENKYVEIRREYDMKHQRNLWYVLPWPNDGHTLAKVPTLTEAREFVRKLGAQ